jgi:hypothetical protein
VTVEATVRSLLLITAGWVEKEEQIGLDHKVGHSKGLGLWERRLSAGHSAKRSWVGRAGDLG